MTRSRTLLVVAGLFAVLTLACSDDDGSETVTPTVAQDETTAPATLTDPITPAPPTSTVTASPSPSPSLEGTPQSLETITITFEAGGEEVDLEVQVADQQAERATGLMWVQSMPEDEGMLFVWPEDNSGGFWMHNTYIPLTVAFAREDGTIIHIEDMQPLTDDLHTPPEPYRYAIETNQGWFGENGIEVGDTVTGLGDFPDAQ